MAKKKNTPKSKKLKVMALGFDNPTIGQRFTKENKDYIVLQIDKDVVEFMCVTSREVFRSK